MIKIAIIGAGQLGSRHLQALGKLDRDAEIFLQDPSEKSLLNAEKRFYEISKEKSIKLYSFNQIQQMPPNVDIGIIATNSDVRRKVIHDLVLHTKVNNLIIEKFLFPQMADYFNIQNLFQKNSINAWVNCPRRIIDFYIELKNQLKNRIINQFNVFGSNWGIGTSSIHMLDLLSYLKNSTEYQIIFEDLSDTPIVSKRKGFYEFSGRIIGEMGNTKFSLNSYQTGAIPLTIEIITENTVHIIRDEEEKCILLSNENNSKLEELSFRFPYQSEMTQIVVQQILDTNKCLLTNFDESIKLHQPLLECFTNYFKRIGFGNDFCPIT